MNILDQITSQTERVYRDLRKVETDAREALERMDRGERPGNTLLGSVFGRSAGDAEFEVGRLNGILDSARLLKVTVAEYQSAYAAGVAEAKPPVR